MEIVDCRLLPYKSTILKHRGSGLAFKDIFLGSDDDIPNNYLFVLARQGSFYSPVHRHNFDQFRFGIKGDISILQDMMVRQGELCYHPEGVYYGPQDDGPDEKEVLVLQFGGASGQGFLSHKLISEAQERLATKGKFEGGKFFADGDNSEGLDAFQALWEDTRGRKLEYPKPRYDRPIKMTPWHFEWRRLGHGLRKKTLGVFSERETRVEIVEIAKRDWHIPTDDSIQLFFVLGGAGSYDGHSLAESTAMRLNPGRSAVISTETSLTVLRYVLPVLHGSS